MDSVLRQIDWKAVDRSIATRLPDTLGLLAELVGEASTLGHEAGSQRILQRELERLGFAVELHEVDATALADEPASGYPLVGYRDRPIVIGRRAGTSQRSLLIQGHVDVVPAGAEAMWTSPPYVATERDGWLYGRGAGDMKGGIAMALLAIAALQEAAPAALDGALSFASVIEEECGGNGALAALLAGAVADGVVIPEPTSLDLLIGGVGVLWVEVEVARASAHAGHPLPGMSALDGALGIAQALRELAAGFEQGDAATRPPTERYHVNIGTLTAGEWISNMPAQARLGARVGFPTVLSPTEAQEHVRAAIEAVDPTATIRFTGFRAEGYLLADDDPLVSALVLSHRHTHDVTPVATSGSATNDARFYARRGISAVCFGPTCCNIHGVDEGVEIASIAAGARTLARLIPAWLHGAPT